MYNELDVPEAAVTSQLVARRPWGGETPNLDPIVE